VARRAVELLQRDLKRQHIEIQWALASNLPPVYADPILIEQVLINLVRNAADALSGHRREGLIRITATPAGERFVRLDVEDDGPGLDGRSIERLTAPFYSTKLEGMGMGLAICRSVIEIHHGSMDAGPSLLGGARLSFTLPLFEAHDVYTQDEEINA
jgi:two-component system sensor histidine kinase DctS